MDPFPLQPYYDEAGWLKAKASGDKDIRSTLGADDGLGIATALALLQDNDLKDYPIECLFTVQEETDQCDSDRGHGRRRPGHGRRHPPDGVVRAVVQRSPDRLRRQ